MADTVLALIVPPALSEPMHVQSITPDGDTLRGIVGGWLEGVSSRIDADWFAYCDEEGKLKPGVAPNERATVLARRGGWPSDETLLGPVVFLGNGDEGDEADVPARIVAWAEQEWGAVINENAPRCPRCGDTYSRPGALSRTDNRTKVCPECGVGEGVEQMRGELTPQSQWPGGLKMSFTGNAPSE